MTMMMMMMVVVVVVAAVAAVTCPFYGSKNLGTPCKSTVIRKLTSS